MRSRSTGVSPTMPSSNPERRNGRARCQKRSAAGRARAAKRDADGTEREPMRSTRSVSAPSITKTASPMPNGARPARPVDREASPPAPTSAERECRHQPLRRRRDVAALPCEQRPERHREQQRHQQRAEGQVEEGRADRNLVAGERLKRERIERADEHGCAGRGQEQIVEHKRAFARDRREQAARFRAARARQTAPAPPMKSTRMPG